MANEFRSPFLVLPLSFVIMWLSVRIGVVLRKRRPEMDNDARRDYELIVASTLTLLGLIIGFSFSMAINRYDQRKNYEEAAANAIALGEMIRASPGDLDRALGKWESAQVALGRQHEAQGQMLLNRSQFS